ncbi:MAG: DsbC family protein [Pseudomonadota bacterium]
MHTLVRITAVAALALSQSSLADETLAEVQAKVDEMFPNLEGEQIAHAPIDGWVTIMKGSIIAYMSVDGQYLMQGDLIDLDNNVNLSEASRNQSRKALMASVGDDEVIAFTPEHVRHSVTIFTDVDCTYCRRLHNQIDGYMAKGIEVRYILYPRNGPASRSWSTSEDVWCASDRNGALTAAKLDRSFDTHKCDASEITRHYGLGQDVGLTGTPAIVMPDGQLLSGWLSPDDLSMALDRQYPGERGN